MLRSTPFPAPYNSAPVLSRARTCPSPALARALHSHSSLVWRLVFPQFHQHNVNISGGVFVAAAAKKQQRRGGAELAVMDGGFDDGDFYDAYDDDEEEEEFDDDDDEEEGMLPLDDMNKWFEKKPRGFGEGKVYDTSVEDKLLEEMRQSRIAQAENLTKLKSNPVKHASNESVQKKKDSELVPIGGRVCLVNLPKKKNIHKDLKSALQGIPGITNIVPAVTGNKKTRDPICKGFAYVDFECEEDAIRFVELYTGQAITFGKIQKQIKCELLNVQSSSSSLKLSKNLNAAPQLVARFEEVSNEDSNLDGSALSSWDEANSSDDLDDLDYQMNGEEQEDDEDNQESVSTLGVDHDDSVEMRIDPEICSLPSEQVDRNHAAEQKSSAKVKQENARKKKPTSKDRDKKVLGVPGSSRRLKIREKAVLSDVFSKYGLKATLASKDN
ncbi:hypothetical protein AAZX31_02G028400 [Glycine max]|uniref:RRM domain-containing protein n=2 Tax=Glycine subgen. Soja TaxID=1462606 RepID=K7K655_SOYBN|nr:uncharacterized protein LOC100786279 [Glycine max]XP_028194376.1 uncharacterized protein LOC114379820 [Glycine soja]KAH1260044.1 hypothetical protein GmHk_02G003268 [Glycine max]KRH69475.1 hypothetical protein GLYMA_02G030100v4 [Glycine max]RZC23150.1 hypothetical protein D0Y65_002819 [Glycine soja]|eukprot:XP_003519804.2 uncharacterized protein LOC100786279 [Glycine max]